MPIRVWRDIDYELFSMIGSLSEVQTDTVPVPLKEVQNPVCEESTVGSGGGSSVSNVCGGCEASGRSHVEIERSIRGDDKSSMDFCTKENNLQNDLCPYARGLFFPYIRLQGNPLLPKCAASFVNMP